jgi:uncharacterized protein YegL
LLAGLSATPAAATGEGTVTGNKTIADTAIACDGATSVEISLTGETGISGTAADIVLVLDRSGSMSGQPLTDLKNAATQFVEILDVQTDGLDDGIIGNGSQIGVVSFAAGASIDQALTSNAGAVESAINGLTATGLTNHEAAFQAAASTLAGSTNQRYVIMFTDGQTTTGGDPDDDAATLRSAGVTIYSIGLGGVDTASLSEWATDPDAEYVFITPSSGELQSIFEAIGAAIVVPAATGIEVVDLISSEFDVIGFSWNAGNAFNTGNEVTWQIDSLGTETVSLSIWFNHDPTEPGGTIEVNDSITYTDDLGKVVTFPSPTVEVHGCASFVSLTPPAATNTVGEIHTVEAEVLDDFGDPVPGIEVGFAVTGGPSIIDGEPSNPVPASGTDLTDGSGIATFSYVNAEASADVITVTVAEQAFVSELFVGTVAKTWEPIELMIDIKPGSFPNSINVNKKNGVIPVAVFGSETFDVTTIDVATLRFGPAGASPAHDLLDLYVYADHLQDVNGDGYIDLVSHYPTPETGLVPGMTSACIVGETSGLDFIGCDSVRTVPAH